MKHVFLQMTSFGGTVIFSQISDSDFEIWGKDTAIDLIKPVILLQQQNPKGEIVTSIMPFPVANLPVMNRETVKINSNQIIWMKEISEISADKNGKELIDKCKNAQIGSYSNIISK